MFLYGGASADICEPFKTPGRAPCDFSEVCIDDAGCRTASPKDCLPGEHCQMHVMGSVCSNFLDVAKARKVCDKTVDCGPSDALCQRYVCKPSEISRIKACECAP